MALNSVKYLPNYGWKSVVITAARSREFGQDNSVSMNMPAGVQVMRTTSWENLISRMLNWLGVVPDAMFGWQPFALSTAKLCREPIAAIISRSNPITSHLIARQLKRYVGPHVPWIALFGDPWTQNPYITYRWPWMKPYREWMERKIVQEADAIIVTTQLTRQLFINQYGVSDKIYVLPNTYDPEEFRDLNGESASQSSDPRLTLTYAGNFYGLRSPEPLFQAQQLIKQTWPLAHQHLRVKFIGSMGEFSPLIYQYQIQDLVEMVGKLPRHQTLQELSRSHVLISVDAAQPVPSIFLPAKLADYLAFKKPILAITPPGETADFIERTGAGLIASPGNPSGIAQSIKQFYQLFSQGKLIASVNPTALNQYSAIEYSRKLMALLDQLVASKTS